MAHLPADKLDTDSPRGNKQYAYQACSTVQLLGLDFQLHRIDHGTDPHPSKHQKLPKIQIKQRGLGPNNQPNRLP